MHTVDNTDDVITYVEQLEGAFRPALAPINYQPENQQESQDSQGEGEDSSGGEGEQEGEQTAEGQGESEEKNDGDGSDPKDGQDDSSGGEKDERQEDGSKSVNTYVVADGDFVLTGKNSFYCNLQQDYSEEEIEHQLSVYADRREGFLDRLRMIIKNNDGRVAGMIAAIGTNGVTYNDVRLANVLSRRDIEQVIGGSISEVCAREEKHVDAPEDVGFALQLRNVMTDNKYDRMLSGRRNGTLDGNMLYKVPAGDIKAFKKREARANKDYHFTLLVDQSGSMEGRESRQAADLGVSLYKAFERSGIDYSCYGYSDYTARYKRFGDHLDPDALYNMLLWNANGNNEYPALVDAYSHFPRCAPSNNFVILLSDGGIDPSQQRKMVEFCKKNARVATLIGLGIGSSSRPMPFCDIDIQRPTIPEAKVELLKQLRNVIRRG